MVMLLDVGTKIFIHLTNLSIYGDEYTHEKEECVMWPKELADIHRLIKVELPLVEEDMEDRPTSIN